MTGKIMKTDMGCSWELFDICDRKTEKNDGNLY